MTNRVLILGVYLTDRENYAPAIMAEMEASREWAVEQRWVALGKAAPAPGLQTATAWQQREPAPKFVLLNRLLEGIDPAGYEYLFVADDDISLPPGFVDHYLAAVEQHRFALAQPARTHDSYIDHPFVERLDGISARRTRFVEIGPLFSFHRSAYRHFLPFDEASPMGWGYDFVWPCVAEQHGLALGIVDAAAVAHSLRPPVAYYDYAAAKGAMERFLAARPHLSKQEAFFIVESYV